MFDASPDIGSQSKRRIGLVSFGCALTIIILASSESEAKTRAAPIINGVYRTTLGASQAISGNIRVSMSKIDPSAIISDSRLRVVVNRQLVLDKVLDGSPSGLQLIPRTSTPPYIFVMTYSGGAHCCFSGYLIDPNGEFPKIRTISFGNYPPYKIEAIGPAGEYQLECTNGTAYTFGSFAGGVGPIRIWAFRNGSVKDVTSEHPALVRSDQRDQLKSYYTSASRGVNDQAALVSYIADGYILNDSATAWTKAEDAYAGDFGTFRKAAVAWLVPAGYIAR